MAVRYEGNHRNGSPQNRSGALWSTCGTLVNRAARVANGLACWDLRLRYTVFGMPSQSLHYSLPRPRLQ